MTVNLISVYIAMALIPMVTSQAASPGGNTMSQCQQTFLQSLYKCLGDNGVETQSFLWMVTNNTEMAPPADADGFKRSTCEKQQTIDNCIGEFMGQLINATICLPSASTQNVDQRPIIHRQFMSVVVAYDNACAHPCRGTLFSDLRACYEASHLNPELFLSNATMARGAVIGSTSDEANTFCQYKDALMKCLKARRDECPESPRMLSMIGLDIDSMEEGVEVLCKHTDIYVEGIECFAEQTKAIEECMDKQRQDTMQLMMDAQRNNLSEPVVQKRFCGIRLDHVECDVGGWRQKNHKSCTAGVIGLRTELECHLLPKDCTKNDFADAYDEICHVIVYNRGDRGNGSGATCASKSFILMAVLPVVSLMAAFL